MKQIFKEFEQEENYVDFKEETSSKFIIGTSTKGDFFNKADVKVRYNYIIFVIDGEIDVEVDNQKAQIKKGEFCFIPISSLFEGTTVKKTKYIVFGFLYSALSVRNKHMFSTFHEDVNTDDLAFNKFRVKAPLTQFLNLLINQIDAGCDTTHLYEAKFIELFEILRTIFSRQEMVEIFYPIMGLKGDFRAIVMDKYLTVQSRHALAELTGMSVSSFSRKFKDEFGEPVYSWMLKQRSKRIYHMLSIPSVSVGDIVKEFNFSSPSHLTKYCRKQFGCTPTELRNRIRLGEQVKAV